MLSVYSPAQWGTWRLGDVEYLGGGEWPQHLSVAFLNSLAATTNFSCSKISNGLSQWTVDLLKVLVQS